MTSSGVVNDVYLMQLLSPRHFSGWWVLFGPGKNNKEYIKNNNHRPK